MSSSVPPEHRPLRVHRDARGLVVEPLRGDELARQANVHLATLAPGEVRGNHVHRVGTEVLAVVGPALVRTRGSDPAGETRDVEVPADEVYRFSFAPGTAHAVRNTGARPTVLVAFSTEPHDPERPDTERVVLLEC